MAKILVVDDEKIIRERLKRLLDLDDHETSVAEDGQNALEIFNKEGPEIVLLDIKMPGMDGIEVARKTGNRCPTIILSAYSERNLIERARDAGVMAYVTKPFRKADLSAAIELAVSNFSKQSTLEERVRQLKEQLETRKLIERAKGLLMQAEDLTEEEAHRRLQEISMSKNTSLKKVAQATILMLE